MRYTTEDIRQMPLWIDRAEGEPVTLKQSWYLTSNGYTEAQCYNMSKAQAYRVIARLKRAEATEASR